MCAGPAGACARGGAAHARPRSNILRRVYWPLIGGFIAFLVIAVLIGWVIDRSERRSRQTQRSGGH
jgi:hypothetical protein